jgi:hypothetical protein
MAHLENWPSRFGPLPKFVGNSNRSSPTVTVSSSSIQYWTTNASAAFLPLEDIDSKPLIPFTRLLLEEALLIPRLCIDLLLRYSVLNLLCFSAKRRILSCLQLVPLQ